MKNYLKDQFSLEIKDGLYAVLPVGACHYCFDSTLEYLESKDKNDKVTVILVGSNNLTLKLHKRKLKNLKVLMDTGNNIYRYGIDEFSYPVLLEIKDDKLVNLVEVKVENYSNMKTTVDKYYQSFFWNI